MSREKSAGGRPKDGVWKHVEKVEDGKWKCKYCGRVSAGAASRIRNHLSGLGNDISACKDVPQEIRAELSHNHNRPKPQKRRRLEEDNDVGTDVRGQEMMGNNDDALATVGMASAPLQVQDPSPCSSNEESVTNAFMKFLMCNKSSSLDADLLKNPYFREFLERANQHGFPSSLLRGESLVIKRSLFNIKEEVHQYMLMVAESWKATNCTVMMFNLNHGKKREILRTNQDDMYAIGLYCPKGFIFVEAPCPRLSEEDCEQVLKRHSPSLYFDGVTYNHILHVGVTQEHGEDQLCELTDEMTTEWLYDRRHYNYNSICLRNEILGICISFCSESGRAERLIHNAVVIHESLCKWRFESWYFEILFKKGLKKNFPGGHASRLSIFLSIMLLEDEVKEKLSYHLRFGDRDPQVDEQIETILNDSYFWIEGKILKEMMTMISRIPDLMDTLVPTAGYSKMAIDIVTEGIDQACGFTISLSNIIIRKVASYLNPVYFLIQDVQEHPEILEILEAELQYGCHGSTEEREAFEKEVQRYGDVFRNLQSAGIQLQNYHPLKLWEKYGDELPLLQKRAFRELSQPTTCMCNQVKKHLHQLQGADDFILRLNLRMMEEFRSLGDDIYKPLDLSKLQRDVWSCTGKMKNALYSLH